jgi:hypothetical protein
VARKESNAVGVALHCQEMESCLAQTIRRLNELGMLSKKLLCRGLVEDGGIHELIEKRIVRKCHGRG